MHYTSLLLPLLTLATTAPAISAAHLSSGAKRHPSALSADFDKVRREGAAAMEAREGLGPGGLAAHAKGKRLVRKKRSASGCDDTSSSASVSASNTAGTSLTSTTVLGGDAWATPTSAASSAATASASSVGHNGHHNSSASSAGSGSTASSSTEAWSTASSSTAAWGTASFSASAWSTASTTSSSSAAPKPTSNSDWTLVETYAGSNFFDNFQFWEWSDPTHGTVDFLSSSDAWNSGLISVNGDGHAIMSVDTTQVVSNARKAIRIWGNLVFTGGMVLMDAVHAPTGCGTWPAWWQNGPNWPTGGEIDIMEGINDFSQNQVSLHTAPGCTMPSNTNDVQTGTLTTGGFNSYDCSSTDTSNQGCGVRDQTNDNSFGTGFNSVGGGVYALVWDLQGIRVWWFPRSSIPSDITNDSPDPTNWGTPVANFTSDSCDPYTYFYDHYNIFDTTLCGDWAGADSVWNYAGYAGQDQSCAALTGYSTCSDFVLNSGSSFADAYWEVSYVKYYNSTSQV